MSLTVFDAETQVGDYVEEVVDLTGIPESLAPTEVDPNEADEFPLENLPPVEPKRPIPVFPIYRFEHPRAMYIETVRFIGYDVFGEPARKYRHCDECNIRVNREKAMQYILNDDFASICYLCEACFTRFVAANQAFGENF